VGKVNPALLDAALHGIPHDRLFLWSDKIADDRVAYPARISGLVFFGPMPTSGEVRAEVHFDGFVASPDLPRFKIQLITNNRVCAEITLVEACFAKGPLGSAGPGERRAFLQEGTHVPGLSLSRREGGTTRLSQAEVDATDWMPGTVEGIYGTRDLEGIAIKEHLAAREHLHPRQLPEALPLSRAGVRAERDGDDVVVRNVSARPRGEARLEAPGWARTSWRGWFNATCGGLSSKIPKISKTFVRRVQFLSATIRCKLSPCW
jgi:hypothetical protein